MTDRGSGEGVPDRRGLYGRLAAVFFAGSGVLGLVTLPIPSPGLNGPVTALLCTAAVILGVAMWYAPWRRWPRWASLTAVPPAFAIIAAGNLYGGPDLHTYGVFFVVVFVWIGMAHPPRSSLAMAPLAAAAYMIPVFFMPGSVAAGLSSATITIPVCVLVGEGISWGVGRLERIELALAAERDRTGQLRELDEMKDRFLSAVSHELRTPLTICRGHLDVLDDAAGEQEIRAVKEILVDELGLMGRLVEDLTTLAWADNGALLKVEPLPLAGFLASIGAKAGAILGDRVRVEHVAGGMLRADPQRLTQALMNLAQNAADHAKGDAPVRFRVRPEPGTWRFEVADEGGGLPPGAEETVFEPFRTGSTREGRTGLGLSIVRAIARAHGGECGVDNRPGEGATFWVRIPR